MLIGIRSYKDMKTPPVALRTGSLAIEYVLTVIVIAKVRSDTDWGWGVGHLLGPKFRESSNDLK